MTRRIHFSIIFIIFSFLLINSIHANVYAQEEVIRLPGLDYSKSGDTGDARNEPKDDEPERSIIVKHVGTGKIIQQMTEIFWGELDTMTKPLRMEKTNLFALPAYVQDRLSIPLEGWIQTKNYKYASILRVMGVEVQRAQEFTNLTESKEIPGAGKYAGNAFMLNATLGRGIAAKKLNSDTSTLLSPENAGVGGGNVAGAAAVDAYEVDSRFKIAKLFNPADDDLEPQKSLDLNTNQIAEALDELHDWIKTLQPRMFLEWEAKLDSQKGSGGNQMIESSMRGNMGDKLIKDRLSRTWGKDPRYPADVQKRAAEDSGFTSSMTPLSLIAGAKNGGKPDVPTTVGDIDTELDNTTLDGRGLNTAMDRMYCLILPKEQQTIVNVDHPDPAKACSREEVQTTPTPALACKDPADSKVLEAIKAKSKGGCPGCADKIVDAVTLADGAAAVSSSGISNGLPDIINMTIQAAAAANNVPAAAIYAMMIHEGSFHLYDWKWTEENAKNWVCGEPMPGCVANADGNGQGPYGFLSYIYMKPGIKEAARDKGIPIDDKRLTRCDFVSSTFAVAKLIYDSSNYWGAGSGTGTGGNGSCPDGTTYSTATYRETSCSGWTPERAATARMQLSGLHCAANLPNFKAVYSILNCSKPSRPSQKQF